MALTAAETQSIYAACGLKAGGEVRYRIRWAVFNAFGSAESSTTEADYSAIKTVIDTRLTALSAGAIVAVQGFVVTFDATRLSSFKKTSGGDGVLLDDDDEFRKARQAIVDTVGIEVEPVPYMDGASGGWDTGRVTR